MSTTLVIDSPLKNSLMSLQNIKWKTIIALAAVWFAVIMNWSWIWGVVFLIWVIPEIRLGRAYFIESVERKQHPLLFWIVILSWILMSVYILVTAFVPKLNPESAEFIGYQNGPEITAQSVGSYTMPSIAKPQKYYAPTITKDTIPENDTAVVQDSIPTEVKETEVPEVQNLNYLSYQNEALYFVGISTVTTYTNNQYEKDLQELWGYFYENDISQVIRGIEDERVFVIYSDYDKEYESYFKVTIGYRTKSVEKLYEGMTGISIPPSNFAVLTAEGGGENDIAKLWDQVYQSDLKRKRDFDVEAYTLDKDYNITKTELWLSLADKK
jgi:predicted transcriptional regulator YdeE